MSSPTKREFERTPVPQNQQNDHPSKQYELMCEENSVRMGITVDRDFTFVRPRPDEHEPREEEHVWLFVPARTSKRTIERLSNETGSRLVRFYVTVRCLPKYIFSDRFDVAYHLNADGQYYTLPAGTFTGLQVQIVSPEQNQGALEFVRVQRVVPHVPTGEHDA